MLWTGRGLSFTFSLTLASLLTRPFNSPHSNTPPLPSRLPCRCPALRTSSTMGRVGSVGWDNCHYCKHGPYLRDAEDARQSKS
jgi:hypothetical protein